jgi:YD repeat-containing protein
MSVQHGTVAGYKGCNGGGRNACQDCRDANSIRAAERRRLKAYGRNSPTDRVDPTLTIQALHLLAAMGHNTVAVQQLTGVNNTIVARLLRDEASWIYRETKDRVLCGLSYALIHPEWKRDTWYVPSRRSLQQIHSLQALGWPLNTLMGMLGYQQAKQPVPWRRDRMTRRNAERVQQLYDELSGTKGPSRIAAANAARLGWHTPLAYDDDGRLIAEAIPNDLSRAVERREDRQARAAQVEELTGKGYSTAEIAERLGVTDRTVTRARARRSA